jgi:hypothetical protein
MDNEQFTLLFLVFIVVVISGMVYRLSANVLSMALVVGVITAFVTTNKKTLYPSKCKHKDAKALQESQKAKTMYQSKQIASACDEEPDETYNNLHEAEHQYSEKDFDIMLHKKLDDVQDIYYDNVCPGDSALSLRMWEQGKRSQQATDARAKFDKYSMLHYLDEELRSNANSRWWDNDALEHKF